MQNSEVTTSTGSSALGSASDVANDAKAIISVLNSGGMLERRRASRNLDVVPPGTSARRFSLALFGSLRIPIS